ncbi:hypothetical protein MMIC_P1575 [Mariprofundus micogutta]|uniref:DNA-binding protein n=1 Tax=Mariprofundus micogutta TaxID=1921010 RepID=A0A1L8CNY9_9PROT|nr:hypothetical protein [Mariprofundus micogutta]GAV20603.1 hypothetical protein MMIC_P1575 [Mariprofundus micogutta]
MLQQEMYYVKDMSILTGRTEKAIRTALCRGDDGKTLPPSIKAGGRRCWKRKVPDDWFLNLGEEE